MEKLAYVLEIDYLCSGIQGHLTVPCVYTQKKVYYLHRPYTLEKISVASIQNKKNLSFETMLVVSAGFEPAKLY